MTLAEVCTLLSVILIISNKTQYSLTGYDYVSALNGRPEARLRYWSTRKVTKKVTKKQTNNRYREGSDVCICTLSNNLSGNIPQLCRKNQTTANIYFLPIKITKAGRRLILAKGTLFQTFIGSLDQPDGHKMPSQWCTLTRIASKSTNQLKFWMLLHPSAVSSCVCCIAKHCAHYIDPYQGYLSTSLIQTKQNSTARHSAMLIPHGIPRICTTK